MTNKNKIALITGATSGFGVVIAKHLVETGYALIILGRSRDRLNSLTSDLKKVNPDCNVEQIICNLSSFKAIEQACESVKKTHDRIDLLALNAGLWNFEFKLSEDEIEETLQVNLLAPVLIFEHLQQLIPNDGKSKVIFTSSGLHQGKINFNNLEFSSTFSGFKAYRQSKLGLILIARLFAQKPEYSGTAFYTVHPGMVNTKLGRNAGWFSKLIFKLLGKSKEKGAQTHTFLIDEPNHKLTSGAYYANSQMTKTTKESYDMDTAAKLLNVIHDYFDGRLKNE